LKSHVRRQPKLVEVARRLHENGWVANHDGNVSVRLTGDRLLITPTAYSKRDIDDDCLLIVDLSGNLLEGRKKPFSELDLHLAIYQARPDVNAVIHAHPATATAVGLCGAQLAPIAMPEIIVSLGEKIPTLPRCMPKDPSGVANLKQAAEQHDAMLISGNGVFTCAPELNLALLRMELVEHYAKILTAARAWGPVAELPAENVKALLEARRKAGLMPKPSNRSAS
jgi:L-fuculose-phosphate aldolase